MPKKSKISKRADPYYQAQAILSRRDHSEWEVRLKLRRQGFTAEQIEQAVAHLKDNRLVNDEQFTRSFIANTLRFKAVGPRWLQAKLRQKGIAGEIIRQVLTDVLPDDRERELVQQATQRWRATHQQLGYDGKRLQQFLLARGFSPHLVYPHHLIE